jgi:hypothetical protein
LPGGRGVENPVQWASRKYFASRFGRNSFMSLLNHKGRIAIVTNVERDAVDAAAFCARWDRRAGGVPVDLWWILVCHTTNAKAAGAAGTGIPHALKRGETFMHNSGASRRGAERVFEEKNLKGKRGFPN